MSVSMQAGNISSSKNCGAGKSCGSKSPKNDTPPVSSPLSVNQSPAALPSGNAPGNPLGDNPIAAMLDQLGRQLLLTLFGNAAAPDNGQPVQAAAIAAPDASTSLLPGGTGITPLTKSGKYDRSDFLRAAGGDQELADTMAKIYQHPEGRKAIDKALDKGVTLKRGSLAGSTAGVTKYGGKKGPEITVENTSVDVVAHELLHAAYEGEIDHQTVYDTAHQIATDLRQPITTAAGPPGGS